jgi:hypothetical protein
MEESAFHQWMEDKAKYQGWLDSQSNQVNQSSTLTSTSNSSPAKQTYKTHPNYHRKANKIQIGAYIYAQLGPWMPKTIQTKKEESGPTCMEQ